jgi:hypothetical protein
MADDTNTAEREAERKAFKTAHRHLELDEVPDAWGRPMFKHSHVEASWLGWQARASLAASAVEGIAPAAPPMDGEIALIEKAVKRVGIKSLLNHGAGSLVYSEGVEGVTQDDLLAYTREIALHCAVALGSPPEGMAGWISVDERLPEVGVTVLVYEPFRHGEDWPGTVRISFDHICPDYEGWHDHCASHEHFMAVGGVNACGSDVTCTGPSEKAPYTHWMPLPAPPLPASEAKEL